MKIKILLFFVVLVFSLNSVVLVYAQSGTTYWREDFTYSSTSQLQAAGWSVSRQAGTSMDNGAVVLNGVGGDSAINIGNIFSSPIYNWKAEAKNMWLGQGHSTQSITVYTEKHKYTWGADGYYNEYVLYRDNVKVLRFGNYVEAASAWLTLTMEKNANTISLYFNGVLENTYTESDASLDTVTAVELISPWAGDAKYDYVWVQDASTSGPPPSSSSTPTQSTFPMVPVLIGGGITAAIIGGVAVYYFFVAGGTAGASAGTGSSGSGGSGDNSGTQNNGHFSTTQEASNTANQGVNSQIDSIPGATANAQFHPQNAQGAANVGGSLPFSGATAQAQTNINNPSNYLSGATANAQFHPSVAQGTANASIYSPFSGAIAEAQTNIINQGSSISGANANEQFQPRTAQGNLSNNPQSPHNADDRPQAPFCETKPYLQQLQNSGLAPHADAQNTINKPQNQPSQADQLNQGQGLGGQQKPSQGQQVDSDKSE